MLVLCMSIIGCQKTAPEPTPVPAPTPEPKQQEFVATLANPITKTTVTDAGKVSWESTDAIAVFDSGKSAPVKATIKSISSDGKTAVFVPASEIASPVGAVYPYDASATLSNNVVSISLGGTQSGAFADANIAASKADGYNLSFQNVTSVFKFKITDENVKSVKLSATGVGGTLDITLGSPISSALSGTSTIDEITVSNIASGTDYYITIAPGSYADLQFSWYDSTGAELGSSSLGESTTVNAGTIYTWGELTEHKDIEYVQFEDANFKAYCVENFDTDGDGEISTTEALAVTEINVDTEIVGSLVGIEYFTNLTSLICKPASNFSDNSKLTTLDVSKNTVLTHLDCRNSRLVTLDLSNNIALTELWCFGNQLSTLDVSKNTALTHLECQGNQLTSLDVSKNTALTCLHCEANQFTTLDVSKNTALTDLCCGGNQLAALDVSKNTALTFLWCENNQLTTLDVSKNTALTRIGCQSNQLTTLNVSGCALMTYLECSLNQLTDIDLSKNTALNELWCFSNQLASLNVSNNTALTTLYCNSNHLTGINISANTALKEFKCSNNQITSLDVSDNTALESLMCDANSLTAIDVSENTALIYLACNGNGITSLNLDNNTALFSLNCRDNQLASLNVDNNTDLHVLYCDNNQLTALDISNNTLLSDFTCTNNQIPFIYVWNGFVESEHTEWSKDSSAEYVVKGAGAGGIDDYSIEDIWN